MDRKLLWGVLCCFLALLVAGPSAARDAKTQEKLVNALEHCYATSVEYEDLVKRYKRTYNAGFARGTLTGLQGTVEEMRTQTYARTPGCSAHTAALRDLEMAVKTALEAVEMQEAQGPDKAASLWAVSESHNARYQRGLDNIARNLGLENNWRETIFKFRRAVR